MKIFVTGGAGFIGSHAAIRLLDEGCSVLTVDKLTYAGRIENLGHHLSHPGHRFEQADIGDAARMQVLLSEFEPDVILHMAAESHVDRSIDSPQDFIETNITGTHTLLGCALNYWQSGEKPDTFKFIHLSTDEVFGALGQTGSFDENSPYRPTSPYSASKAAGDLLVKSYGTTYGFPAVIVHPSNTYGPRQYPEKLIPLMILNALEELALPVYGDGQQRRDWLHVDDHVEALWQIICRAPAGQSYCLGGGSDISNLEMVEALCACLDRLQPRSSGLKYRDLIKFVDDRPGHDFRYASSTEKIRIELGWSPSVSLEDGLEQTVAWYLGEQDRLRLLPARQRRGQGN